MAMLLGKKIGMTQVYDGEGRLQPVTVIHAGPCSVMQVKTDKIDGYTAVQLGYGNARPSRSTKPQIGHAVKADVLPKQFVREMRLGAKEEPEYNAGDTVTVSVLNEVKLVEVTGTRKGKGYAGVMKRHVFGGFPA